MMRAERKLHSSIVLGVGQQTCRAAVRVVDQGCDVPLAVGNKALSFKLVQSSEYKQAGDEDWFSNVVGGRHVQATKTSTRTS